MTTTNPEHERQRLAQVYAGMADGELEELAEDPASLTEPARQALKDEMSRRGLTVALPGPTPEAPEQASEQEPAAPEPVLGESYDQPFSSVHDNSAEPVALEPVFETYNWSEASLVKALLESNGMEVTTQPATGSALYAEAGFLGFIQLLVPSEQAEEARRLIEESEQEAPEEPQD
jgi:hypothetical protein